MENRTSGVPGLCAAMSSCQPITGLDILWLPYPMIRFLRTDRLVCCKILMQYFAVKGKCISYGLIQVAALATILSIQAALCDYSKLKLHDY